ALPIFELAEGYQCLRPAVTAAWDVASADSRLARRPASHPAPEPECPRPESNQRTRFRKPLLYPLSYGGAARQRSAGSAPTRLYGRCHTWAAVPLQSQIWSWVPFAVFPFGSSRQRP